MWAGLVSFFKALPVLLQMYKMWEQYKDAKIKKHYEEKKRVRRKITGQIKEATTDEERKRLIEQLTAIG